MPDEVAMLVHHLGFDGRPLTPVAPQPDHACHPDEVREFLATEHVDEVEFSEHFRSVCPQDSLQRHDAWALVLRSR
jgi:hypothetical protein